MLEIYCTAQTYATNIHSDMARVPKAELLVVGLATVPITIPAMKKPIITA